MELYLLKSGACIGIFYVFYLLFLEKESVHTFKRFYLLGTLLGSFLIPLITFTQFIEVLPVQSSTIAAEGFTTLPIHIEKTINYIPIIIGSIYGLGVLLFGVKFSKNLYSIFQKIKKNPKYRDKSVYHVLLQTKTTPHTFFNFIFLNKSNYESKEIPEAVLLHETAHAEQKHSLDILLIEFFQVIFWFNPLIYFIRRSIKLNHEFLADRAVLRDGIETSTYQQLLLAFSSSASTPELANSINYSLIKKRFTVMKTKTKPRAVLLRTLLILPLVSILIYGFSSRELIEKEIESNISVANTELLTNGFSNDNYSARSITIEVIDDGNFIVEDMKATKKTLAAVVNSLHQDITPEERNKIMNIHLSSSNDISNENVWFIYNSLLDYGFHRIVTNNQEVVRAKGNTPFAIENIEKQASSKKPEHNNSQKGASKEQLAEYNRLAKKYNSMPRDNMHIKGQELTRMKYIYELMTPAQKKNAEPYPDLPPPPPPPAPNAPKPMKVIKGVNDGHINAPPPPPSPPTMKVVKGMNDGDTNVPPPPPPPPPPESPLDHIISMAKKGATFYYEGKKVSSDQAIKLIKKRKNLNIQTTRTNSDNPQVKLSKKPITYEKSAAASTPSLNIKTDNISLRTGNVEINGEDYFYATKNGVTSYFNKDGTPVDKNGKKLTADDKQAPTYYYNGAKISSLKARYLLETNSNIQVATENLSPDEYAIVLTNINTRSNNNNNINFNSQTQDPQLIDLREVISKGATFYYNDKKISTERAQQLVKNSNQIAQVNVIKGKNGKPVVHFWSTEQSNSQKL